MTINGVLFDFSGTLFRLRPPQDWLDGLLDEHGETLDVADQVELMQRMTAPFGWPSVELPEEWREHWETRDLDPAVHRAVYLEMLRRSGIRDSVAEALYARLITADYWQPYPDTEATLRRLRDAGVPIAVVSNIAWDIRTAFTQHKLHDFVDEFVLSYVEGAMKPDPRIFLVACERLGLSPQEVLMVGDSAHADGAAADLGAAVALVEPLPVEQRPDALLGAMHTHAVLQDG